MTQSTLRLLTLTALCLTLAMSLTAGDIYVSKAKGVNANPGTREKPVQEIELRPVVPYEYLPADKERESVSKTLE